MSRGLIPGATDSLVLLTDAKSSSGYDLLDLQGQNEEKRMDCSMRFQKEAVTCSFSRLLAASNCADTEETETEQQRGRATIRNVTWGFRSSRGAGREREVNLAQPTRA